VGRSGDNERTLTLARKKFVLPLSVSGKFRHIFGLIQHAPTVMIVLSAILMLFAVAAADGSLLEKYANVPGNVYHGR